MARAAGARGRLPGVANRAAESAATVIGQSGIRANGLAQPNARRQAARHRDPARGCGEQQVERREGEHERNPGEEHPGRADRDERDDPERERDDESTGNGHERPS
jgi:hypothetical protein